jgi:hypothetical protein
MKTVCGMFATPEHLDLFSAEAVEKAVNTDAETGARLPQQPDIRFVDARDVFPMLGSRNSPGSSTGGDQSTFGFHCIDEHGRKLTDEPGRPIRCTFGLIIDVSARLPPARCSATDTMISRCFLRISWPRAQNLPRDNLVFSSGRHHH